MMSQASKAIGIRRVKVDGEEAQEFRRQLHKLGDSLYRGPPRVRVTLPESSVVIVAEMSSEDDSSDRTAIPMGSVAIKPLKSGEAEGLSKEVHFAEIKRMVVLPEFQGTGVAQKLLSEIEEIGKKELGAQCIVLETLHALVPAGKFYQKSGYRKRSAYGVYDSEYSQCYEKWL